MSHSLLTIIFVLQIQFCFFAENAFSNQYQNRSRYISHSSERISYEHGPETCDYSIKSSLYNLFSYYINPVLDYFAPAEVDNYHSLMIEESLKNGDILNSEDLSTGMIKYKKILTLKNRNSPAIQIKGVFKPIDGDLHTEWRRSFNHEIAAYEIDKFFNIGIVPPTVIRTFNGIKGSLQHFISPSIHPSFTFEQGNNLKFFDYLVGNCDRHVGNILFDLNSNPKKEYAIDNGLAFNSNYCKFKSDTLFNDNVNFYGYFYNNYIKLPVLILPSSVSLLNSIKRREHEFPSFLQSLVNQDLLTQEEANEVLKRFKEIFKMI